MIYEGNETYTLNNGKTITLEEFKNLLYEILNSNDKSLFINVINEVIETDYQKQINELKENIELIKDEYYDIGYEEGKEYGYDLGYDTGYNEGYNDCLERS